ncbi:UNVERIFIED_CONTAM: Lipase [Sesamum indicum]
MTRTLWLDQSYDGESNGGSRDGRRVGVRPTGGSGEVEVCCVPVQSENRSSNSYDVALRLLTLSNTYCRETHSVGRIGAPNFDPGRSNWHGNEDFADCGSFHIFVCVFFLQRIEREGEEQAQTATSVCFLQSHACENFGAICLSFTLSWSIDFFPVIAYDNYGNGRVPDSKVYISDLTELFTWTCSRCGGLTEGFEIIELIVDVQHCLQAFVGVAADLNAIVIAFRGTQETSIQNWVEDLYWKQLDSDYPGVDDAKVHHGFYSAYHNTSLKPGILNAVQEAKELYGDIQIMVTGHSMGGAMAAFCGLDLRLSLGEQNVQVLTFGQPRIGNAAFASYYSQVVPNTIRVTNGHDVVPHLPPYYYYFPQKTYHHFPREVWLYNIGFGSLIYTVEKVCDGSGEDPTCSRSVSGNSISDHLTYYGVHMGCDASSGCKIIMDPRVVGYGKTDQEGNLILSRDPSRSILKLKTDESSSS